ncbi:GAF domain-containing protein [Altericista sp. CCNU0014]|uniref:GAF domain-containing protein n=1 Tax=Altericista sp. CCNU0014 TaxID=3082949 RepID=UPI00384A4802
MDDLSHLEPNRPSSSTESQWLQRVVDRLCSNLQRDTVVRETTLQLQQQLQADRVVLYYFFRPWKGQVVSEALSDRELTILGSTGADDCFNDEYAALYEAGRYRAIDDTFVDPIHECHREFLHGIRVRANLAVPILIPKGLWGLLVAHYCHGPHAWLPAEIEQVRTSAKRLAATPSICES